MVFPGSPAAEGRAQRGHVITQINGVPPTDASLASAFERPVGTGVCRAESRGRVLLLGGHRYWVPGPSDRDQARQQVFTCAAR
jgi:hypothetical protein